MKNALLFVLTCFLAYTANAQCQAGFTFTTSGLTANFTNTSTPNYNSPPAGVYVTTMINHGNGVQGFYTPITKTYSSPGTYQVKVYVKLYDSLNNTLVCSDSVTQYVTVNYGPCTSTISTVQSGKTVVFTANNVSSTPGMTYYWHFGDGSTGTGSPVTHTYLNYGNYYVSLVSSSTTASCSDSISKYMTFSMPPANKISGWVLGDTSSVDTFMVWLIQYDSSTQNLYAVDSTVVWNMASQGAYYEFNNATPGKYRVKAHQLDGPTSGTGYLPTYHLNSLYWNTASVIYHWGGNTTGNFIYMQMGTVTAGPSFIAGNVTMGANKGTAMGDPVDGMVILLRDNANNAIKYTITDANGAYSFANLPAGLYSIFPEEVGYTTTSSSIILTPTSTTANAVNFEKSDNYKTVKPKTTGINDLATNNLFSVSPNPSNGLISINWETGTTGKADITVTDISGRKVHQSVVDGGSNTLLNLDQLQAGMYFINVHANGKTAVKQIVIQK